MPLLLLSGDLNVVFAKMKTLFHISSLLNNHLVEEEPAYHFYSFEEF